MEPLRIALVSREVYPFGGGGLGGYVTWTAAALSSIAEVTVVTMSDHEQRFRELSAADDRRIPPGVRFEFVPEVQPDDIGSFYGHLHLWSARAYEALCDLYPDGGPDIVEFPDYHGEGSVTVQARRTLDPRLRNTLVCVRTHSAGEICSVLDGHLSEEFEPSFTCELERYSLRYADRLLWPGGDVLGTYRRYYGDAALAPAARIRHVLSAELDDEPPLERESSEGRPLRFLYLGRLERRKGVRNLVEAAVSLPRDDWSLTLLGGDTDTAPLGQSVRAHLELIAADDPRVRFVDSLPRRDALRLVQEHDALVVPSLWECWPYAVLEALHYNRPVVATPTGGLVEMIKAGRSGWLAHDTSASALAESLDAVLDSRDELEAMIAEARPARVADGLTDVEEVRGQYAELAEEARRGSSRRTPRRGPAPLVSVIVPYFHLEGYVEETLRSILDQTYEEIEVLLVNDGSLRPEDRCLLDLAERYPVALLTQPNSGLGGARNFGVGQSRGRYVFPLDADNVAHPSFVERCVDVLESDPEIAFVTSWSRYIDENGVPDHGPGGGYQPMGNSSGMVERNNVAGDAAAVVRRRVFDLGHDYSPEIHSFEDWLFYRELHRAGLFGHVIPERLLAYRIRSDSMIREVGFPELGRLVGEMGARVRETAVRWTS